MDSDKLQNIQKLDKEKPMDNNSPQVMSNISIAPADQVVTVVNQPPAFRPVGPTSMEMTCPSCRCRITTTVRHRSTCKTHVACLLLTGICCCCLPYCMDTCRNANHFCPMCGVFLGTYSS